jgi:hypothetical protein
MRRVITGDNDVININQQKDSMTGGPKDKKRRVSWTAIKNQFEVGRN